MLWGNELAGKTIVKAEVDGFGIRLRFDDGMIFDFDATDGGCSLWELYRKEDLYREESEE